MRKKNNLIETHGSINFMQNTVVALSGKPGG
jgi:hypothetical protein